MAMAAVGRRKRKKENRPQFQGAFVQVASAAISTGAVPQRLVIIGMIIILCTIFVSPKPLLESDRGSRHLRMIRVVPFEEVGALLESVGVIPLLVIFPVGPFNLILKLFTMGT